MQVFGCLRLDGKKMPLKFFYPKWVNGERVSGTLDGAGYYKLLRLDLNIFSFKHYYIWFKNVDTTASLKSGIRTMVHLLTRVGNRLVIINFSTFSYFYKKSNISASCILICKLSLTWSWHSLASACLKCIYIFPKDGASPHRTNKVLNYLQSSFGTRTLALGAEGWGAKEWCPNSPDLAPMDFCIWGVMKVKTWFIIFCQTMHLLIYFSTMYSVTRCHRTGMSWWTRSTRSGTTTSQRTWFRRLPRAFSTGARKFWLLMADIRIMSDSEH